MLQNAGKQFALDCFHCSSASVTCHVLSLNKQLINKQLLVQLIAISRSQPGEFYLVKVVFLLCILVHKTIVYLFNPTCCFPCSLVTTFYLNCMRLVKLLLKLSVIFATDSFQILMNQFTHINPFPLQNKIFSVTFIFLLGM